MSKSPFLVSLLVFAFIISFFSLSFFKTPFSTRGEGREALVVRAMFDQDNLILPLRNGEKIPSKPPFFHWLGYAATKVFGTSPEFSIRFPSALCGALLAALFFYFAAKEEEPQGALLATGILITAFEWSRGASHARVDMSFAFPLALAVIGLYKLIEARQQTFKSNFLYMCAAVLGLGGATLAKGPAGFVLPLLIIGAYWFLSFPKTFFSSLKKLPLLRLVSVSVFGLALGATWYLLAYEQGGESFFRKAFIEENLSRVVEVDGFDPGHQSPFYFSVINFFVGFLPWSLFFPAMSIYFVRERKNIFPYTPLLRLALAWVLVFVGVVSLSSSQRTVYLLPAYPAAALMVCYYIANHMKESALESFCNRFAGVVFSFIGILGVAVSIFILTPYATTEFIGSSQHLKPKDIAYVEASFVTFSEAPLAILLLVSLSVIALIAGYKTYRKQYLFAANSFISALLLGVCLVNYFILPSVSQVASPKEFMAEVRDLVGEQNLIEFGHDFYPAVYYAGRNVPLFSTPESLHAAYKGFVLLQDDELSLLQQKFPTATPITQSHNFAANGNGKLLLAEVK